MLIMLLSAFSTSLGQYFWKISHSSSDLRVELTLLFVGFLFYGVGALCMIIAFKFGSFSVLHPMQSVSYIFALLIGYFALNECITPFKMAGLLFILFGVFMIGVGDE
jgi:drug/metabolite transporter (DMT)-like permease